MGFCQECGSKISVPQGKFCPKCGAPVGGRPSSQAKQSVPEKKQTISQTKPPTKEAANAPSTIKPLYFGLAIVIIIAILVNLALSGAMAVDAASKSAQRQLQMQDTLMKYSEDLQRGQIQADAKSKKQIINILSQFEQAFNYNDHEIELLAYDYNTSEKMSDSNAARKANDAKQLAGLVNNYMSQVKGLKAFLDQNGGELERLDNTVSIANMTARLDNATTGYYKIEDSAIADLEKHGSLSQGNMNAVNDAIQALRDSEAST